MFDVVTVGSSTIDVFVDTESELIKFKTPRSEEDFLAYPAGSKILVRKLIFTTGGGGTNTAVTFARMGLKTGYLGKVGNDDNGKKILSELRKEKIKFIGAIGNEMSGYSVILDSIEEDRTIMTYKGANDHLHFDEIRKSNLKAKWFYFSSMVGESYETLEKLAAYAKSNKIKIAFNPSNYLAKQGRIFLKKILDATDAIILNKQEANLILGLVNAEPDMLLKGLHLAGPKMVIITDGKHGVHAYDGRNAYYLEAHKIKVVETTGAGDAYASAFVAGLMKTNDFKTSLKIGLVNADAVLTGKGAKVSLLRWKDAMQRVKTGHFVMHSKML